MNKLFISLSSLSSASVAPGGWWSAGRRMTLRWPSLTLASLLSLALAGWGLPGAASELHYDLGQPVLADLWVDPALGDDAHSGATRAQALRTITAAWQRLPAQTSTTGYRIQLAGGVYPDTSFPVYWEGHSGSFAAPLILNSADGPGAAQLNGNLNIFGVHYLYLTGLAISNPGDVLHCEQCEHILLRQSRLTGGNRQAHETIKMNQSRYIYIEDSDISQAYENALDFVSVQYGHIVRNRFHDADDWCIYLKGGSAYFSIESNEIDHCGTGGFTAGQGTGFEYMTPPWLHYEAYGLRVVNNVIHHTDGAGLGVNGGYAILMAYNTLYRVGARSHVVEFVFGSRSCDGDAALPTGCADHLALGGWGTTLVGVEGEPIPNRTIHFINNLIYNPPGMQSQWQHFAIYGPQIPSAGSHIPSPARTDDDLRIQGNLLWNGPADHPLGVDADTGCQPDNPTCNTSQLLADNAINTIQPGLVNPEFGNFHPAAGGSVFSYSAASLPVFPGWNSFTPPVPAGNPDNVVATDHDNLPRAAGGPVGAFASPAAPPAPRLINISTRAQVGVGDNVMIGGFVIGGSTPHRVLIRAIGPSLASAGVAGTLANPNITLTKVTGEFVASNDNWQDGPSAGEILALGRQPAHPNEAALLLTLEPNTPYTPIVDGVGGTQGVALVEVYELP